MKKLLLLLFIVTIGLSAGTYYDAILDAERSDYGTDGGGGGGGTPAGLSGDFQYNDAGSFGGVSGMSFSGDTVTIDSDLILDVKGILKITDDKAQSTILAIENTSGNENVGISLTNADPDSPAHIEINSSGHLKIGLDGIDAIWIRPGFSRNCLKFDTSFYINSQLANYDTIINGDNGALFTIDADLDSVIINDDAIDCAVLFRKDASLDGTEWLDYSGLTDNLTLDVTSLSVIDEVTANGLFYLDTNEIVTNDSGEGIDYTFGTSRGSFLYYNDGLNEVQLDGTCIFNYTYADTDTVIRGQGSNELYRAKATTGAQTHTFNTGGVDRLVIETDGTLSVDTPNYETLIIDDDDIPNKKYVDDNLSFSTTSNVTSNGPGDLTTDDFVFGSYQLDDVDGVTDYDSRMFFDKAKGAFRAGTVTGTQWNDVYVGIGSFAVGSNSSASGDYSFSMTGGLADGDYSFAAAHGYTVGDYSFATTNSDAIGVYSFAVSNSEALGDYSFAMSNGYADGAYSGAMGNSNAHDYAEFTAGQYNVISGGSQTQWEDDEALFTLGNGTGTGDRNNAFQVLKNGNTMIDGTLKLGNASLVAVDTIEETLTDDDTHIPTSSAVVDAITAVSTNVIYINSDTDLPTPQNIDARGNCYHLAANKRYVFTYAPTLTIPFAIPNDSVRVTQIHSNTITWNGTGALFRGLNTFTDLSLEVFDILIAGDGTNTCFDIPAGLSFAIILSDFDNIEIGILDSIQFVVIERTSFKNITGTLSLNDCNVSYCRALSFQASSSFSDVYISLSGTTISNVFVNCQMVPLAGDTCFNLDSGLTGFVNILGSNFVLAYGGTVFDTGGLDQTDLNVNCFASTGVSASHIAGEAFQTPSSSPIIIDIPAQNAYVISNVDGWIPDGEERITIDATGFITLTALEEQLININRDMRIDQATSSYEIGIREWIIHVEDSTDVTFTNGTNVINETATALVDDDTIVFRNTAGTLPAELRKDIIYYVVNKATNTFQISYTEGGSAITFTDDGTPTNQYHIVNKHGSEPSETISAGTPKTLSLKSQFKMHTGDISVVTVINKENSNNIRVYSGGYVRIP